MPAASPCPRPARRGILFRRRRLPLPDMPRGAAVIGFVLLASTAAGEPTWSELKCQRYAAAWDHVLAQGEMHGISQTFRSRHSAFIDSGCTARANVCPRSEEEFALANALTVMAMNAGAASTFLPFACRD